MEERDAKGRRKPEAHPEEERRALGKRLAAARALAGFTIDSAKKAFADKGYEISRAAIGAWEAGRNVPDAFWLRRMAKLYGTTLDALVWDEAISMDAIKVAVQYDALNEKKKKDFEFVWMAFIQGSKTDAEVERDMAITRPENRPQTGEHHTEESNGSDR